ncbi:MAG: alpha/beta fold hydrolase [Gammaproteobacteria bacterium]
MKENSLLGLDPRGFHRIAYTEWGRPDNPRVVLCLHGLTRNGRDFDPLAAALAPDFRVLCPDVCGRGRSDWLHDGADYTYPQYCADMTALIARANVESVDVVGTSMGGFIGMMLASRPGHPLRRLVLNDIGPFVPKEFSARLAGYVGMDPAFDTVADFERDLRANSAAYGKLPDELWRHYALHGHRIDAQGRYRYAYDPAIGTPFRHPQQRDVEMWPIWEDVDCPVLLLRGMTSDLMLPATVERMARRAAPFEVMEVPGVGHVPALADAAQIDRIRAFLLHS